jgi:hypothetical protein
MPLGNFFGTFGPTEYFALLFAAAIGSTFVLARRRRRAHVVLGLAAFLPAPIVALFSKEFDFVGWHGFMHAAPIYQLMERGLTPPEDPIYAGGPLRYPWIGQWLAAKASLVTGIHPLILDLVAETFAYAALLLAVAWIAAKLSRDPVAIGLSMLLAAFGISIFHSSVLATPVMNALAPLWLESRLVPVDKFLNVTAAPIGYAAMAVSAAAGFHALENERDARKSLVLVAAATTCAALVHPLSFLGVVVYQTACLFVLLLCGGANAWRRVVEHGLAVGVPSAVTLPYLRSLGISESSDGWSGLTDSFRLFGDKLADLGFFLVTFAVFAYLHRADLSRRFREREPVFLAAAIAIGVFALAYLFVRMPGRNEYKFLVELVPAAAPLLALSLRARFDERPGLALAVLFLLMIPGGMLLGSRPWFLVTEKVRIDGRYHRALEPATDQLYAWIATRTPSNAVFLAADLRVPPLGRRSLYVAVDAPWRGRDGWGVRRNDLMQWHVRRPDRQMYRRQHLATIVLNPTWAAPPARTLAAIQHDVPGRPVFVHAYYPALAAKLGATPGFSKRFENEAGAVFSYQRP